MPMMKPTLVEDKCFDPQGCLEALQTFVRSAAGAGTPVHEVERGLWRRLLQLGYQLQGQFFTWVGDGDQGETVTLAEGQVVRRDGYRSTIGGRISRCLGLSSSTGWSTGRGKASRASSYPWMPAWDCRRVNF